MGANISITRDQYLDSVTHLITSAQALLARLNMSQLTWQPAAGEGWSIVECLDHIAISAEAYLNSMESAVADATPGREANVFRAGGFISGKFLHELEPPSRRKMRAPRKILPRPTLNPEGILPTYVKAMERVFNLARSSSTKDLNAVSFGNPFLPLIRMTAATGFLAITAHGRRHLWQAEQVTAEPDFPR